MTIGDCRFCVRPDRERILYEGPRFVVMMGLGPITEGYVLIITTDHHSCLGALPPTMIDELEQLIEVVGEAQRALYGASMLFEHGRSGACLPQGHGEDHCYHAHLHLNPVDVDLTDRVRHDHPTEALPSWSELARRYADEPNPYLLLDSDDGLVWAPTPQRLPRHYLRTLLAEELGAPHLADWVAFPEHATIRAGMRKLRPLVLGGLQDMGAVPDARSPSLQAG
jgi:diadenosine tetraphosphate (Ap4A) HIT family hydrolase